MPASTLLHLQSINFIFKLDLKILCYMVERQGEKAVDKHFSKQENPGKEVFLKVS